jgi:release factor glutamine methyltransferase
MSNTPSQAGRPATERNSQWSRILQSSVMLHCMNTTAALDYLTTQLAALYDRAEARAIARLVMEAITGKPASAINSSNNLLSEAQQTLLEKMLAELRQYKPVQYVTGKAWFYNMELMVNNAVLIPRPETEELVQWILEEEQPKRSQASILDIGTGSGCIPIALKKNWPAAEVFGLDVSAEALAMAQQNATTQQTQIQWLQASILEPAVWPAQPFDIIVSNPPYIPQQESEQLDKNVTDWEPHLALFVPDTDPLLFYNAIAEFAKTHLQTGGSLYFECHQHYVKQVLKALQEKGFMAEQKTDMFGNERMVKAKPSPPPLPTGRGA